MEDGIGLVVGSRVLGVVNRRQGLGRPLASRIVARHGGTLELDDSELGGARFVVTLPVVATDDH